jgi:hypothetical protein
MKIGSICINFWVYPTTPQRDIEEAIVNSGAAATMNNVGCTAMAMSAPSLTRRFLKPYRSRARAAA